MAKSKDEELPTAASETSAHHDGSTKFDKGSHFSATAPSDRQSLRRRSTSRDSSVNDDPKSLIDSISAASGRQNWSSKDMAEDDPSISSIKGDSISATIADYNRKHRLQTSDNQSRTSARLAAETSSKNDDLSVHINFYAAGCSTSGIANLGSASKAGDFASVSSNANIDAFDIIEESSNVSSCEDISRQIASKSIRQSRRKNSKRNSRSYHRRQSSSLEQALGIDDIPQEAVYQIEPIIIRGNGNLTLFGLSNSFNSEFPSALLGRVSKEEFGRTIRRINNLLRDQQSLSAKILLFGGIFCCCSLGFSLVWPSIALKKRSKISLEKLLASENNRLYSKLGLNWKLAEQRCYSNHAFVEYVLMIEFTPKINLYLPD